MVATACCTTPSAPLGFDAIDPRTLAGGHEALDDQLGLTALHFAGGSLGQLDVVELHDHRLAMTGKLRDALFEGSVRTCEDLGAIEIGIGRRHSDAGNHLVLGAVDTDDAELVDVRHVAEHVLHVVRIHVLSGGGHDDVLAASRQDELTTFVQLAQVAGVEPAVSVDDILGGFVVAEVATHDVRSARENLAHTILVGIADFDLDAGDGLADLADAALRSGSCHRQHRCSFGEAITLRELQPDAFEHLRGPLRQCTTAADQIFDAAAELVVHLSKEEAPCVDPHGFAEHAIELDCHVERFGRQRTSLFHLLTHAALEHLPERGHPHHRGDTTLFEAFAKTVCGDLADVADASPTRHRQQESTRELERVMKRQHAQHTVARPQ